MKIVVKKATEKIENEDVISLTVRLIQTESTNPGIGEINMENLIRDYFKDCKVVFETDPVEEKRENLIITIPGENPSPALVWICHMDTVVTGSNWTKDPFGGEIENGKIFGRGSCDMKAGLACAMSVFRNTAKQVEKGKKTLKYPLRLICTVDEEGDMKGVDHLIDKGFVTKEDLVMDLEPTDGKIQMAHKGRFWVELSIHGITAHASRPEEGADAIAAAGQVITRIRNEVETFPVHEKLGKTTVTFGQIQGGYQPYVVPDECKIWMDFRLAPPVDGKRILNLIEDACGEAKEMIKGVSMEYKITGNRPYVETNESSILLEGLKKAVHHITKETLEAEVFPGYTDTAVIAGRLSNKECLSYGPGSLKYAHKPDEFVEVKDILRCEKVLFQLVKELL